MVRGLYNISVPNIGYTMTQGSKMSFHVDPSALIYSHFEHVSGMAAPDGTDKAVGYNKHEYRKQKTDKQPGDGHTVQPIRVKNKISEEGLHNQCRHIQQINQTGTYYAALTLIHNIKNRIYWMPKYSPQIRYPYRKRFHG